MTTGLVLGKFAPLHRGHQLLIDAALAENDRVVVLIYDAPETTVVPLDVRAGWLRRLYPRVEVREVHGGPTVVSDAPEIRRQHEATILEALDGRRIERFYSSEFYGAHVSTALGAADRRIDPERRRVPVSGTAIRRDPYAHRRFLDPIVYRDLVTKVVLLGAPSTGKTTLARELAARYDTVWVPEYGREYWEAHQRDRRLTLEQLVEIAEGHREREDARVLEASSFCFIDTDATTTLVFSLDYHGEVHPRLEQLASCTRTRYDVFFLCGDDIPYDDTWDRSGEVQRERFQARTIVELERRGIPYVKLEGSLERRLTCARATLDKVPRDDA